MSKSERVLRLRLKSPPVVSSLQEELLFAGGKIVVPFNPLYLAIPSDVVTVRVSGSPTLNIRDAKSNCSVSVVKYQNQKGAAVKIASDTPSSRENDVQVVFQFLNSYGKPLLVGHVAITVIAMSIHSDVTRDGVVNYDTTLDKSVWTWGTRNEGGIGAILLVNNDCDGKRQQSDSDDARINGPLDLEDMSRIGLKMAGPVNLPPKYRLVLHSDGSHNHVRVFELRHGGYEPSELIGPRNSSRDITHIWRGNGRQELAAEGIDYPDKGFDGLGCISISVVDDRMTIYQDQFVFRVAPWIMTPNTLTPRMVFVARMVDGDNTQFIHSLKKFTSSAGVPLEVVSPTMNKRDRWMQDEIELGYSQAPHKGLDVVLDSPRDRGLKKYPKKQLLGPDFGYVTRGKGDYANSLDSFGNLEVSPPIEGYPFGRIIFGGSADYVHGRRMMKEVRDFLIAQQVQAPIEVFSDWLVVGHVDEFMTFVPADKTKHPKKFKLLLASPAACYALLERLHSDGLGDSKMFEGKTRWNGWNATTTAKRLLQDKQLCKDNTRVQEYIDYNRTLLKHHLKLDESDIIDIPALFVFEHGDRAGAYFPNMVNMLVLGHHLGIPKPFGPHIGGQCAIEHHVSSLLNPLGLVCHFIDDWSSYHVLSGEIHCGTNTLRRPFDIKWWETKELQQ